jgi:hypothetical protein
MWSGLVWLQANAISLLTVKRSSNRPRQPRNLTVHQFQKFPEAAAEFQRILSHRGIVVSDPIGALAHLQPPRAYSMSGDPRAKSAYQDFVRLWKDADPEIPILKHAKAEGAKLQ